MNLPKTSFGRWSLWFGSAVPVLLFAGVLVASLGYESVPAGNTLWADLMGRPALALAMLGAMASGVLAFITGMGAIVRQHEAARIVYVVTTFGAVWVLFLLGEVLFPH